MEAQCRNKPLVDRKKALDMEKERARKVADMPSPQSYDIVMVCVNEHFSILLYLDPYRIFILKKVEFF